MSRTTKFSEIVAMMSSLKYWLRIGWPPSSSVAPITLPPGTPAPAMTAKPAEAQ